MNWRAHPMNHPVMAYGGRATDVSTKLDQILKELKEFKMATDNALANLQTQIAALQTEDAAVASGLTALASAITSLNNEVATLQSQLGTSSNLDPAIQAQADLVQTETANLTAALSAALKVLPAPASSTPAAALKSAAAKK